MNGRVVALVGGSSLIAGLAFSQTTPPAAGYELTGAVVMSDGRPVPPAVGVELICNGRVRKRVKPYVNGDFRMLVNDDSTEMPDISVPGDPFAGQKVPFDPRPNSKISGNDEARFDTGGCDLRAVLPGYQSNVIALQPRRPLDQPDVGKLQLHRIGDEVLGIDTAGAPNQALKAFENARKFLERATPDYAKASQELEKATGAYPNFAVAWNLTGVVKLAMEQPGAARTAFARAVAINPNFVEPYVYLARMDAQQQRWSEALKWVRQAQHLDPTSVDANFLGALVNFELQDFEAAERSAVEVIKRPEAGLYPQVYFILGTTETQRGDLEAAARNLRRFLETKPDPETAASISKMLSEWEKDGRITKSRQP